MRKSDMNKPVPMENIKEIVRKIAERFRPQKVILFGSYAYGRPTYDSDVDLLILMETSLRNVEQAVEIRRAVDFPFPADVLVRTPQQIANRLALGDVFLREVISKGIVLHEADSAGVD